MINIGGNVCGFLQNCERIPNAAIRFAEALHLLAEVGARMLPQAVRENFVAESRSPDECAAAFCDPSLRLVTIEVSRNDPRQGVCSISNLPEE